MKRIAYLVFMVSLCACSAKHEIVTASPKEDGNRSNSFYVSDPLVFTDVESLNEYAYDVNPLLKS